MRWIEYQHEKVPISMDTLCILSIGAIFHPWIFGTHGYHATYSSYGGVKYAMK